MTPRTAPKVLTAEQVAESTQVFKDIAQHVKRLSEPATDPETTPEPEPLPDTPEHKAFRLTQEFVTGLGFDPRQVTTMTIDANGVRVFHRNAEGRNLAKMVRFSEILFEHRQRIIAEVVGE